MKISIQVTINASIEKVWLQWNHPDHILHWNFASDDWCCPAAQNNLEIGGKFNYRMESKDATMGFDFTGTYTEILKYKKIKYKLDDKREVIITYEQTEGGIKLVESFEAEDENSAELQKQGWQNILNNFKNYVETSKV